MKHLLSVILLLSLVLTVSAQVKFDVRAGVGTGSLTGGMSNTDCLVSYKLGAGVDLPIGKSRVFAVEPGLFFSAKGMAYKGFFRSDDMMENANYTTRLTYLEIPVCMVAKLRLGSRCGIIFKAGPYLAYGLNGKTTVKVQYTDFKYTFPQNHFNSACDYSGMAYDEDNHKLQSPKFNRVDAGITEGIDFRINHFLIGMEAAFGLTPVCNDAYMGNGFGNALYGLFYGSKPKNVTVNITAGYRF